MGPTQPIRVTFPVTGETLTVDVVENDSIGNVKFKIQEKQGTSKDRQTLIYQGRVQKWSERIFDGNLLYWRNKQFYCFKRVSKHQEPLG